MVSIVMPIYNRANLIEETLISIKAQTYVDWECIIVDDGSSDNTFEVLKDIIKKDSRFTIFKRPDFIKKGPSACRNYALTKTKGYYIQFFDSDDIMHPKHLELKINIIADNDLVVCKLKPFNKNFNKQIYLENDTEPNITNFGNVFENYVSGRFPMMMVAPLWRYSSLKPYLPIREDLHILEDHEIYARALYSLKKIAIVNKSLIFYRTGRDSSTNRFYKDVDYGLTSYLEVKRTVLSLLQNECVKLAILKMILGVFRQALAERNFKAANRCLKFIKIEKLCYSLELKLKYLRVYFFYTIFKIVKSGDTKFKRLFKI